MAKFIKTVGPSNSTLMRFFYEKNKECSQRFIARIFISKLIVIITNGDNLHLKIEACLKKLL